MYTISLIPMAIVNGFLTALPVVIYDNTQNLGIRIGSIPVEDFIYSAILLLMNIALYERSRQRNKRTQNS
jgi:lycopene cyclase domain-containing protein